MYQTSTIDQINLSFRTLLLPHERVSFNYHCYHYFSLLLLFRIIIISEHCFSTMDVFLMVRRKKTTIFLDAKETTTVVMITMIMLVASKL